MSAVKPRLLDRTIDLGDGWRVNGFWHCFGPNDTVKVDKPTVLGMLDASGTSMLPINTHRDELTVGHGAVTWQQMKKPARDRDLVPVLNINLVTSVAQAVERAERAREQTDINILKLEVLADDLVRSNDAAVIQAAIILNSRGFTVMPPVSCSFQAAWSISDIVPVIRVMGSPIGSGLGILQPPDLSEIANVLEKPVVLDGGVGTTADAKQALELGCAGFLVNSALFADGGDPVKRLAEYRELA